MLNFSFQQQKFDWLSFTPSDRFTGLSYKILNIHRTCKKSKIAYILGPYKIDKLIKTSFIFISCVMKPPFRWSISISYLPADDEDDLPLLTVVPPLTTVSPWNMQTLFHIKPTWSSEVVPSVHDIFLDNLSWSAFVRSGFNLATTTVSTKYSCSSPNSYISPTIFFFANSHLGLVRESENRKEFFRLILNKNI